MSNTAAIPSKVNFVQSFTQESGYKWEDSTSFISTSGKKNVLVEDRTVLTPEFVNYYNMLCGTTPTLIITEDNVVKTRDGIVLGNVDDVAYKRYIKGCNTPWKIEQDKRGIKPVTNIIKKDGTPVMEESIWLYDGELWVDVKQSPADKGLLLYLMIHNQNESFPFRDDSIASAGFKIRDFQKEAKQDIEFEDVKQEAKQIVYSVRNPKTKTFDEEKLTFYSKVFKKQLGGLDSSEEKFRALLLLADTNPDLIVKSVDSSTDKYLAVIQKAKDLQILVKGRGNMSNTQTGNVVITFKSTFTDHEITEKLISYYASSDGASEFDYLTKSVEAHKNEQASS